MAGMSWHHIPKDDAWKQGTPPVSTRGGVLRDQAALACNLVACQCQGNNSATRLAG